MDDQRQSSTIYCDNYSRLEPPPLTDERTEADVAEFDILLLDIGLRLSVIEISRGVSSIMSGKGSTKSVDL
jgi:hypothetical protein